METNRLKANASIFLPHSTKLFQKAAHGRLLSSFGFDLFGHPTTKFVSEVVRGVGKGDLDMEHGAARALIDNLGGGVEGHATMGASTALTTLTRTLTAGSAAHDQPPLFLGQPVTSQ